MAGNRIKIRHGSTTPTTSNLLPYELGWDGAHLALYINNNGTCKPVGGEGLFLALTGGTLTGDLVISKNSSTSWSNAPSLQFVGANDKIFKFKLTESGNNVDIGWDWAAGDGAGVAFRNSNFSTTAQQGAFRIYARKNTTAEYVLQGDASGALTWCGNPVIVSGDDARKIWVTTSSSYSSDYANGDIVLVKA